MASPSRPTWEIVFMALLMSAVFITAGVIVVKNYLRDEEAKKARVQEILKKAEEDRLCHASPEYKKLREEDARSSSAYYQREAEKREFEDDVRQKWYQDHR
jgi:hypothetical protein